MPSAGAEAARANAARAVLTFAEALDDLVARYDADADALRGELPDGLSMDDRSDLLRVRTLGEELGSLAEDVGRDLTGYPS